ncbi:MAG: histidine kinase dimerization/phospho-acceptor domain-containing protein [Paracoccaceae bacterium]
MRPNRSLRRDLALGFGAGIVLVWFLALMAGWVVLRSEIDEIYDAALGRTGERLLALSGKEGATPRRHDLLAELVAPDGSIAFRSAGAGDGTFAGAAAQGVADAGGLRILTLRTADGSVLRIADPLKERREAARETLVAMLAPSVLLMPLALAGAVWFTRRRLAPVTELSAEVAGRGARDLRPLSPRPLPVELEPIRASVDHLMAQLSDALTAERAFSANAAHELRTPVAATLAQTQRLIAEADSPALRDRAGAIAAALRRIARLSEKLLDLARAEGAGMQAQAAQDMAPVLRLVASDFGEGVRLVLPEGPVPVGMDIDAFAVLARNLIENATVHGLPPVTITLDERMLRVENAGPPVPPQVLPTLTRRFERAGSQRPGAGLGLAIAETLARNAGARLDLASPAPGRNEGFVAQVRFADPPARD